MKKFIHNIFIFLTIILLFNIGLFIFANDNYYKGYKDFPSKNFKSFIMADSHGMPIEKNSEYYKVYNFSANSDSYFDMKRKISYLVENNYQVKTIYLSVDDHSLSPYRDQNNNSDKSIIYTSSMNLNYFKEKYLKYYFPIFQLKINPLLKIYLDTKIEKILNLKDDTGSNFVWNELNETEKNKRAKERINGQFPSKNKSKALEKILLEIIFLCKTNNIELIGIKFPLSNSYLKLLRDKNYGADKLFLSNGLKVIDYKSIYKNQEKYFGDQDHLNTEGGKEFIKTLLK
ncbi:hypothetical protein ACFOWU_06030 [Epilithonimonas zeae]|uniref:SGNH/GDSL hydrolase family protein n=1 Tax=Epilithonimonas zeae TaxID=1416779 RepID=A0A1N6FGZ6_9FLAO|nr:hypothetical protein [Epilithonimonas zeae]SIN94510.1 hypothetical protein SAMN05444409_1267 [Epilithonimonas zeae]